jgi:hypothetical protein
MKPDAVDRSYMFRVFQSFTFPALYGMGLEEGREKELPPFQKVEALSI